MKKLILILLFTSSLFAQSPFSALIPEGRYTMSITPSDRIWMAGILQFHNRDTLNQKKSCH
ncbi:hypothetical protein ACLI1A_07765 [Flavobacterium sp. RHBU_3]|uniref:hypothetical protein n=1 Tax=Flavobacterium sp. RHBU_3 TaxID=3391184 RepID=UPI003984EDA5